MDQLFTSPFARLLMAISAPASTLVGMNGSLPLAAGREWPDLMAAVTAGALVAGEVVVDEDAAGADVAQADVAGAVTASGAAASDLIASEVIVSAVAAEAVTASGAAASEVDAELGATEATSPQLIPGLAGETPMALPLPPSGEVIGMGSGQAGAGVSQLGGGLPKSTGPVDSVPSGTWVAATALADQRSGLTQTVSSLAPVATGPSAGPVQLPMGQHEGGFQGEYRPVELIWGDEFGSFSQADGEERSSGGPLLTGAFAPVIPLGAALGESTEAAPTGLPQPLSSPLPVEQLADRLAGSIFRSQDGQYQVTLQLHPEHLGELKIRISLVGGQVEARLATANPAAIQTLQAGSDQLKEALGRMGLTLAGYHVGTSLQGQSGQERSRQLPEGLWAKRPKRSTQAADSVSTAGAALEAMMASPFGRRQWARLDTMA